MPEIITRAEAKARGLKRYFTGKPCCHGHVCEIQVSDRKCVECNNARNRKRYSSLTEEKKDYFRKWRARNRKRIAEYNKEYNKQHRERYREYYQSYNRSYTKKVGDLIAVLRLEMPDLLKEFGL